jgi:hypothetical protein
VRVGAWDLVDGVVVVNGSPESFLARVELAYRRAQHAVRGAGGRTREVAVVGRAAATLLGLKHSPPPPVVEVGTPWSAAHVDLPPGCRLVRLRGWQRRCFVRVGDLVVASARDTILDAAETWSTGQRIAVVQEALYARRVTPAGLLANCRRGKTGSRALREAVAEVMGGVDSAAHARNVAAMVGIGLPRPECGVELVPGIGGTDCVLRRPGASAPPWGFAVETDGPAHDDLPEQREHDRRKDRSVSDRGWLVRRYGVQMPSLAVAEDLAAAWLRLFGPLPRRRSV